MADIYTTQCKVYFQNNNYGCLLVFLLILHQKPQRSLLNSSQHTIHYGS